MKKKRLKKIEEDLLRLKIISVMMLIVVSIILAIVMQKT